MGIEQPDSPDLRVGAPPPAWIAPSLDVKEGRDPLGLQTTTQDRLTPVLLPGILELSRRARYFSFYAFLLAEYRRRRMPADSKSLSEFIKYREWELGLAVQRCPHACGSSPVGARKLGSLSRGGGPFRRGESVESAFGGYGLYYRSPMVDCGVVARSGTLLGSEPIPIDVLRNSERARRLAATFKSAVEGTAYYHRAMWTTDDLPIDVIDELAGVACLCQLDDRPDERDAIHDALFGIDPPSPASDVEDLQTDPSSTQPGRPVPGGFLQAAVLQRSRSVAHYLSLVDRWPEVVKSEGAYRDAMWSPDAPPGTAHAVVAGQWAALIAKDVWQDALCSLWSEFCRAGLRRSRELGRGLTWDETRQAATGLVEGPPHLDAGAPTTNLRIALDAGTLTLPDREGVPVDVATASIEKLRTLTEQIDTATSGLVVLLELDRRAEARSGGGWDQACAISSAWQPSISAVMAELRVHLAGTPTVGDTLWWLVSRFILPVHERIAYSKLPEFTFRFRWEDGLLRFYDHGVGRFPLAAIRAEPLASLTSDLGMWHDSHGVAKLTDRGRAFAERYLA